MSRHVLLLLIALLSAKGFLLPAQSVVLPAGGEAAGSGGSGSYSVGQVFFSVSEGVPGSVIPGVQQPFEISVITANRNSEEILLECIVFPNPTHGKITLRVGTEVSRNLSVRIMDINGRLVREMKIETTETEITMDDLKPSTYFLKVLDNKRELKTFKIIKH